jgi:hypothetical protein
MRSVPLANVAIDQKGWMRLYPADETFEFIYRAASGVHWDTKDRFLHAKEPGEWTYPFYFKQIVSAVVSEYGVKIQLTRETKWSSVPDDVRVAIEAGTP